MSGDKDPEKAALVLSAENGHVSSPTSELKANTESDVEQEKSKLLDDSENCDINDICAEIHDASGGSATNLVKAECDSESVDRSGKNLSASCDLNHDSEDKISANANKQVPNSNTETECPSNAELNLEREPTAEEEIDQFPSENVVATQPTGMSPLYPLQLESLLDCMQVVIHKANFRHNIDNISETATAKYEVIDIARKVLFYAEKELPPLTEQSFQYRIYDKNKQPAIEVYSPQSSTCFMCHSSWHCLKKFKFQAVVFSPPGIVAGFVRRSNTFLLQEFEILSPQEDVLLLMRGGPYDLEVYSTDLDTGLGRMAVHGWHGIMHEVKRSGGDIGLTFPLDLDVRVKAILLGAVFAIDWLYSTRNGTRP